MKRTPLLLLVLLVACPLGLLAWGGLRLAGHEQKFVENQIRDLLTERLRDIDGRLKAQLDIEAAELQKLTSRDDFDPDELRQIVRSDPRIFQVFVLNPDGPLLYPDPTGPLNTTERDFILRASTIINDHLLLREQESEPATRTQNSASARIGTKLPFKSFSVVDSSANQERDEGAQLKAVRQAAVTDDEQASVPSKSGWYVWFWGPGINLIYWQRRPSGHLVGVALDRSRWIADLIATLPDTPVAVESLPAGAAPSRFRLIESGTTPIYQWGWYDPPEGELPVCEVRLSEPLSAWQLEQYLSPSQLGVGTGKSIWLNLATGLAISALGLCALAWAFYQNYARDIREASRRVSFVNQVSHELRTPLTNIRLYAELLEKDFDRLDIDDRQPRDRLGVVVSESQRLSRLISNVLTFAQQERKTLAIQRRPDQLDRIIVDVVDSFRPTLTEKGFEIELALYAPQTVQIDTDAVEQILCNLISNVEKYAAEGKWLRIESSQQDERSIISVLDRGAGVPAQHAEDVFEPFWRGSSALHHAAGTGIGLTIVRELARLHGGEVTLLSGAAGAQFQVTLQTPRQLEVTS